MSENNQEQNKATGTLPKSARVVIIGGGSVGTSVLYHLAKMGWTDCLLLEKNELTSGSTWHAAGNCPNYVGSWTVMKMQSYSTELYRRLGDEVDYPMNYHVTGAIRLAHSRQRMEEFRHVQAMGRQMGVEFEEMSNADMQAVYPFLETHDLVGGQWDPLDGDIDPAQLTQALAKGARDLGAQIIRFCPVTGVDRKNDEWHVHTPIGTVQAEYVVNAAGYRADEVGKFFGRDVPCVSLAHQYLVTEGIPELANRETKLPLLRDLIHPIICVRKRTGYCLARMRKTVRRTGSPLMIRGRKIFPSSCGMTILSGSNGISMMLASVCRSSVLRGSPGSSMARSLMRRMVCRSSARCRVCRMRLNAVSSHSGSYRPVVPAS